MGRDVRKVGAKKEVRMRGWEQEKRWRRHKLFSSLFIYVYVLYVTRQ